ncbi:hypothetical protein SBA5_30045 [Candidatus Sulfotelmatomonas gaucii]|uniref:Uncharacterized protein n=1 Tax=Candidatus Sulfuritelmatomonas gaucii TaxID=2043161 RepID=A0A2N9LC39_9BACT|nr:hypothetical protein SBA5_30045 [Candidatus Sulfotelmatomonas gaucii]
MAGSLNAGGGSEACVCTRGSCGSCGWRLGGVAAVSDARRGADCAFERAVGCPAGRDDWTSGEFGCRKPGSQ